MRWVVATSLTLAISFGMAHAAEQSATEKAKDRNPPAATTEKNANADPEPGLKIEKPKIDLPGGMTGTVGTIEAPDEPLRPGYLGPESKSGPRLPAGGLILKKEF